MQRPQVWFVLAAFVAVAGLAVLSCSKDKSTNPPPPVAGLELDSGTLPGGRVFQHTFANAGTYNYKCTIHSSMLGTVTVDGAAGSDSAFVSITDNAFNPTSSTIKPGGHVRWLNQGGNNHTVTSR
jgi:plastocyanin